MMMKISGEVESMFREIKRITRAYEYDILLNAFKPLRRAVDERVRNGNIKIAIYNTETKEVIEIMDLPVLDKVLTQANQIS